MSSASATRPASVTGGFNEATFEAFLNGKDEPAWLRQRRRDAFAAFLASPWPTSRDEEWRRTDIRALKLDAFAPPATHEPSSEDFAAVEPVWDALSANYGTGIAQVNSAPVRAADPATLGEAVFLDLGRAAKEYPELLERYLLTEAVVPSTDAFSAL